jgi:hypothetical protein
MFGLRTTLLLRPGLLRAARMLAVFRKANRRRQLGQLPRGQIVKHRPFVFRDHYHHPAVCHPDLIGHVIARDFPRHHRLTMHRPQRRLDRAQQVIRPSAKQKANKAAFGYPRVLTSPLSVASNSWNAVSIDHRRRYKSAITRARAPLHGTLVSRWSFGIPIPRRLVQDHRNPPQDEDLARFVAGWCIPQSCELRETVEGYLHMAG